MFTPHSTPSRPYIPRGTFSPTNKPPKPPIHNPYDKFTQPEFDVWIDDITGALRRALGHYTTPTNSGTFRAIDRTGAESESDGGEWGLANDSSEDESVDDSFGELRATHLKGKARDPREGPGLGGKNQPIEIESDPEGDEGGSEGGQPKHGWRGYSEDEDVNTELPGIDDGQGMNADEPIELISDKEDGCEREFRNTDEEIFEEDTDGQPQLVFTRLAVQAYFLQTFHLFMQLLHLILWIFLIHGKVPGHLLKIFTQVAISGKTICNPVIILRPISPLSVEPWYEAILLWLTNSAISREQMAVLLWMRRTRGRCPVLVLWRLRNSFLSTWTITHGMEFTTISKKTLLVCIITAVISFSTSMF